MKIARFLEENQICYGKNYREGIAGLLEGRLFDNFKDASGMCG